MSTQLTFCITFLDKPCGFIKANDCIAVSYKLNDIMRKYRPNKILNTKYKDGGFAIYGYNSYFLIGGPSKKYFEAKPVKKLAGHEEDSKYLIDSLFVFPDTTIGNTPVKNTLSKSLYIPENYVMKDYSQMFEKIKKQDYEDLPFSPPRLQLM